MLVTPDASSASAVTTEIDIGTSSSTSARRVGGYDHFFQRATIRRLSVHLLSNCSGCHCQSSNCGTPQGAVQPLHRIPHRLCRSRTRRFARLTSGLFADLHVATTKNHSAVLPVEPRANLTLQRLSHCMQHVLHTTRPHPLDSATAHQFWGTAIKTLRRSAFRFVRTPKLKVDAIRRAAQRE